MSRRKLRPVSKTGGKSDVPLSTNAASDRIPPPQGFPRAAPTDADVRPKRDSANQWWLPALVLVAIGIAAYFNSFQGVFLFDDEPAIVFHSRIRQLWPPWPLLVEVPRPILYLSLALNHAAGGLNTWGYHAVNLCIHILAGLALFGIVRRMLNSGRLIGRYGGASTWLALAISAIWLVHPLQTESITYIIQRAESMMGMFFLVTLYCAIRAVESARPRLWSIAAVAACALGMGSKEVTVGAPIIVFLYDWVFLFPTIGQAFRQRWKLYAGLAATWVVLIAQFLHTNLAEVASQSNMVTSGELTPLNYFFTQSEVILHYLRLAIWPHPLILDYAWPIASPLSSVVPSVIVMVALVSLTVFALVRRMWVGFWGAWFFVILAPTSSIMPVADVAFEHRMYLPLAAIIVMAVIGGHNLANAPGGRLRISQTALAWMEAGVVVALVTVLGCTTALRNDDYRSLLAMWTETVARRPANPRAHLGLAAALISQGRTEEAMPHFEEAYRLKPDSPELYIAWGAALAGKGRYEEAIVRLTEAVRLGPGYVTARAGLGAALTAVGRYDDAAAQLAEAVRLQPDSAIPHEKLGIALYRQGKVDEAISHYMTALRLDPGFAEAHNVLGVALMNQRKLTEAAAQFGEAIRLDPRYAEAHNNLGNVLQAEGRADDALAQFSAAMRLSPGQADAHYNLGLMLLKKGDSGNALREFAEVVRLDPANAKAHNNMGFLLYQQGRAKEAIEHFREALRIDPALADARKNLQALESAR